MIVRGIIAAGLLWANPLRAQLSTADTMPLARVELTAPAGLQRETTSPADTARPRAGAATARWCQPGRRGRRAARAAIAGVFVGGNLGLYEYFRRAWWSGERADFFFNNDWNGPFRDQDKLGHMYGGYVLSEAGRELLKAACVSDRKAAVWGTVYAAAFQLQIEVWDGTQARYGFSPPDLLFNSIGQGISLAHGLWPATSAVRPTFSYSPTMALRRTQQGLIPGELRPTVDYAGQTYWLSVDVDTLLRGRARRLWPGILRASVGHSTANWTNLQTGANEWANRRWFLSLDLDPLRLPGQHPAWVATKKVLRHYRYPAPALEITTNGVRGIRWRR
jgi:uncharacterized protein YfiM (DUF2279 family)